MTIQLKDISGLLVTGAAAAAIAVALAAPAAAAPTCVDLGTSATQCQSPGNFQIDDTPPAHYQPQYPYWDVFPRGHRHHHHR